MIRSNSPTRSPDLVASDSQELMANRMRELCSRAPDRIWLLRALADVMQTDTSVGVYLVSESESESQLQVLAGRLDVPESIKHWARDVAREANSQNRLVSLSAAPGGVSIAVAAVPITNTPEVLILLFEHSDQLASEIWMVSFAASLVQQFDAVQSAAAPDQQLSDSAALIEAIAEIETATDLDAARQKVVDFLAEMMLTKLGPEAKPIVYLGMLDAGKHQVKLQASSGPRLPDDRRTDAIVAAMSETISRQQLALWPPLEGRRYALVCHRELVSQLESPCLMSLEISDYSGSSQAVVLIESKYPLTDQAIHFCQASATSLGSALNVVRRAETNHVGRWLARFQDAWRQQRTKTIARIAAGVLLVGLIPTPSVIQSDCDLQPATRRFVSAPFDSRLESSDVEPGDTVEAGQLLARLDEREIKLELAEVEAEYHRARKDQDGYLASHQSGEARLAEYKAEGLQARQELLRHRFDNLELRSPISGMVIAGDLQDARGMPLKTGQSLFEIALLDRLTLDILIPADDIRFVEPGSTVSIRFDSLPFERFHAKIERVNPAAEIRDSKNVFIAKASIENRDRRLSPGLQGTARVRSSWQPIAWQYLRKPLARSWRWLGW